MSEVQNNEGCTEESCAGCAHADSCSSKKTDFREPANKYSNIKKVIGVVSGKGGVGKSLVTASLARMMRKKGYTVGILDADITGPSIPKMYGVHDKAAGAEDSIFPCVAKDENSEIARVAKDETRIMSVNLLLPDESAPVIWRGPIIAGVVKQFWDRCHLGRHRLSVRGYAARNRRRSADCISVSAGGRRGHRDITAGSGEDDREESCEYGCPDEYSGLSGSWRTTVM